MYPRFDSDYKKQEKTKTTYTGKISVNNAR